MKSSLPAATKAQKRRFEIAAREIGCICCRKQGWAEGVPAQMHHLHDPATGKRRGHSETIPLCDQHHWEAHNMKRIFHDEFGSDDELLQLTNELVAEFEGRLVTVRSG